MALLLFQNFLKFTFNNYVLIIKFSNNTGKNKEGK